MVGSITVILGLFGLGGEGKPNYLHYMRLPTKKDTVLAIGIGRSLHKNSGRTFVLIHSEWKARTRS